MIETNEDKKRIQIDFRTLCSFFGYRSHCWIQFFVVWSFDNENELGLSANPAWEFGLLSFGDPFIQFRKHSPDFPV